MANILLNNNYNTWLVDQNKTYVGAFNQSDKLNFRFNADMSNSFNNCRNLNFNIDFYKNMFENVTNMSSTFRNCVNLNTNLYVPAGVTDLSFAYANCDNVRGQAVCSDLVTNMRRAYAHCRNITNYPVCGNNVTDFRGAYELCNQINKAPVCGPNVTDMSGAYNQCRYLTGNPVCGPKVTNMAAAYYYCNYIKGNPVCGEYVTDMSNTYYECYLLNGNPVCGNNVINMARTYMNCTNLTGSPVCGPNVTNIAMTYNNCRKLTGAAVCGDKVINMYQTYAYCVNITTPAVGPNVNSMWMTYYQCNNLTEAICTDKVDFFYSTYSGCNKITTAVCGNSVYNFEGCYSNCQNLITPAVGPKVTYMGSTYRNCQNLTGNPISGPNTVNMYQTYQNCRKIGGTPDISDRVYDLQYAFDNTNVEVAIIPSRLSYAGGAYRNCYNLRSIASRFNCNLQSATFMFCGCNNLPTNLNIWLPPSLQSMSCMFGGSNSSQLVNTAGNFYFYGTYQGDYQKGVNTIFNNVNNSIVRNIFVDSTSTMYNNWINVGTWTRDEQHGCMAWLNYRLYPIANFTTVFGKWVYYNKNIYNNNIWEFGYKSGGTLDTYFFRDVCNVNVTHDSNVELALGASRPCGINCTTNSNNELIELYAVLPDEQSCDYFYVEPADGVASTDFTFSVTGTMSNKLAYSKDKSAWTTYENGTAITINSGEKLYFKSLSTTALNSDTNYLSGEATNNYKIGGRISSLILTQPLVYSYNTYNSTYALARLFMNSTKLVDASKLMCDLASNYMYYSMFEGCVNLVHPCKLIVRELYPQAHMYMFKGCTSLVSTPRFKAIYASTSCCESMFEGCTSLVKIHVPTLTNTTIKAYNSMFKNCSSLQIYNNSGEGHTNPISILGKSDYQALDNMFLGTTGDYATSGTPTTGSIIYTQNIQVNEESDTYQFDGWYDADGNLVSTANPYPFTVSGDTALEARASLKS